MAGEYVFTLQQVTKQVGPKMILEDVNLSFFFGAKIGVIGGNGSGKTSLLRILAGQDKDFMGQFESARNVKIGYLEQEPLLNPDSTVQEVVAEGVAVLQAKLDRHAELCDKLGEDMSPEEADKINDEYDRLQNEIDAEDLWNLDHHVEMAMEALRVPPGDAKIEALSGGEKRRVALCRLLLQNPDVLLLDEPTNHLDAESVGWLEEYLKRFKGTLIVVTHDRYFLANVTEWILELDSGRTYPYKGNYEAWLEQKQIATEIKERQNMSRRKLLEQELEWVRMNASSRLTKNKARIKNYEKLAAQEFDAREERLSIQIPSGRRLGNLVVEAQNLSMAYGDRIIMENVSFSLPRGGIVGIIGGNGAGKTTLFRLILSLEKPTSGEIRIGDSVDISYVNQLRDDLDDSKTIWEEITGGNDTLKVGEKSMNSRAYCARFNFKGTDQQKKIGTLSGGERNRVHLAKLLRSGGNLLLLDEPSNDLDITTLRSLEDGLANFGGCAMVISHDRWFLDRIATHILAFTGESEAVWFEGNYQAYHEWRRKTLGQDNQPRRVRYRSLRK